MKTCYLVFVVVAFTFFSISSPSAAENYGVMEFQHLGYVAGNSNSERYDYVLLFKLREGDAYRAMADIEAHVAEVGDILWKIGTLDNIVVATIQTGQSESSLMSRYARASWSTSICSVYSRRKWNISDAVNDVHFGDRSIRTLCTTHIPINTTHDDPKIGKHSSRPCNPPGSPGSALKFGKIHLFEINDAQSEYWFCLNTPFEGLEFQLFTGDKLVIDGKNPGYGKLKVELFDSNFNRVDSSSSSSGWGGDDLSKEIIFEGLTKGTHYIRISEKQMNNRRVAIAVYQLKKWSGLGYNAIGKVYK